MWGRTGPAGQLAASGLEACRAEGVLSALFSVQSDTGTGHGTQREMVLMESNPAGPTHTDTLGQQTGTQKRKCSHLCGQPQNQTGAEL